mmetsp:Transcript_15196/g.35008  ORF Transcript_15196/g.35008 Transcript_15196/m.35008 type:complete len:174 (+) Transcript_15196:194-715(+)
MPTQNDSLPLQTVLHARLSRVRNFCHTPHGWCRGGSIFHTHPSTESIRTYQRTIVRARAEAFVRHRHPTTGLECLVVHQDNARVVVWFSVFVILQTSYAAANREGMSRSVRSNFTPSKVASNPLLHTFPSQESSDHTSMTDSHWELQCLFVWRTMQNTDHVDQTSASLSNMIL